MKHGLERSSTGPRLQPSGSAYLSVSSPADALRSPSLSRTRSGRLSASPLLEPTSLPAPPWLGDIREGAVHLKHLPLEDPFEKYRLGAAYDTRPMRERGPAATDDDQAVVDANVQSRRRIGLALSSPVALFILHKIAASDEGIALSELGESLDAQEGWIHFARLLRADLVTENGRRAVVTEAGDEVAALMPLNS